ncbi:predicted protein [Histoplasma capsulatum G186AR]|uniref:Uncharacterized protein n=1 Tax=Ajellomyces capsulatus (strain G186AR / H82 / ATCC MYA-2454 / RMSCC 2432) TaxID=447093 RepID=C0NR56_AJECG|nr:uncharacterized protein HCBG_05486 [Histoplasma capsulatum G186AR]EEH06170.1 predicted protein [Histoplasma capsulatum G186AR]
MPGTSAACRYGSDMRPPLRVHARGYVRYQIRMKLARNWVFLSLFLHSCAFRSLSGNMKSQILRTGGSRWSGTVAKRWASWFPPDPVPRIKASAPAPARIARPARSALKPGKLPEG